MMECTEGDVNESCTAENIEDELGCTGTER
jgi:hypothetical protein